MSRFKAGDQLRFVGYATGAYPGDPTVGRTYTVLSDGCIIDDVGDERGLQYFTWEATPVQSAVNRPNHYTRFAIEPIHFIAENKLPFMAGNVIKYVCRWDAKDGIQDLKKAARYLEMMIKQAEGNEAWSK